MPIARSRDAIRSAATSTLWLKLDGDAIADVSFKGQGCAISKASASLMTTAVKGKTRDEAEALFEQFHELVTGKLRRSRARSARLAARVRRRRRSFRMRVKCASLAWHALHPRSRRADRSTTATRSVATEGA